MGEGEDERRSAGAIPVVLSRRTFLGASAMLPLLRYLPRSTVAAAYAQAGELRFFDDHQAAVVTEATARLIPGPDDDPAEAGHPGAREAQVVVYIDLLLSAFDDDPPRIFAGGPWSDRSGGPENDLMSFVPLTAWEAERWQERIASLQDRYRAGIDALDQAAGGDFTAVPADRMDEILLADTPDGFRGLLFEHAIEGTYALPEYGGNHELVGWTEIGFAGDVAPRGWTAEEVQAEVPDPVAAGVEVPFPPDMAQTGTDDPLGGLDEGSAGLGGGETSAPPDAAAVLRGSGDWFDAALPGLARTRRRPRGGRTPTGGRG